MNRKLMMAALAVCLFWPAASTAQEPRTRVRTRPRVRVEGPFDYAFNDKRGRIGVIVDIKANTTSDKVGARIEGISAHHIRDVNCAFALDDGPLRMRLALAGVALDDLGSFDDDAVLVAQHLQNAAALAALGAGNHHHFVILFYVKFAHNSNFKSPRARGK